MNKKIIAFMTNQSIRTKLMVAFLFVATLSLSPAMFSLQSMKLISQENDQITEVNFPIQMTVKKAQQDIAHFKSSVEELLRNTASNATSDEKTYEHLNAFKIKLLALQHRTNSNIFKEKLKEMGLQKPADLRIEKRISPDVEKKVNHLLEVVIPKIEHNTKKLIEGHNEKINYIFEFDGESYNIGEFASHLYFQFNKWGNNLKDSVKYNVPFKGITKGSQTDFSIWYQGFKTNDRKLQRILKKLEDYTNRIYRIAGEINKVQGIEKAKIYKAQEQTDFRRYEKRLLKLRGQSLKLFRDLSEKELNNINELNAHIKNIESRSELINQSIGKLVEKAKASEDKLTKKAMFLTPLFVICSIVASLLAAFFIGNMLSSPILKLTNAMNLLASGKTDEVLLRYEFNNEIGHMYKALHVFKDNALETVRLNKEKEEEAARQQEREKTLAEEESTRAKEEADRRTQETIQKQQEAEGRSKQAQKDMEVLAEKLQKELDTTIEYVHQNSDAALQSVHEMSGALQRVEEGTERVQESSQDASKSVNTVAESSQELSKAIQEISGQVSQASQFSKSAVLKTVASKETILKLAETATDINSVIALITDIADQTNLLALNATIEAVRAGEAGKGFAVVAAEVKNLSMQTAKATKDITAKVEGIHAISDKSVKAIQEVVDIINEIEGVSSSISAAVEEQSIATSEINNNTQSAAKSTDFAMENTEKMGVEFQRAKEMSSEVIAKTDDVKNIVKKMRDNLLRTLRESNAGDRRKKNRYATENLKATMTVSGKDYRLDVQDISVNGLRAQGLKNPPAPEKFCTLKLSGFSEVITAKIIESNAEQIRIKIQSSPEQQVKFKDFITHNAKKNTQKPKRKAG